MKGIGREEGRKKRERQGKFRNNESIEINMKKGRKEGKGIGVGRKE